MRDKKFYRVVAFFLILNILAEVSSPTVLFALTSGPAQPETSSFEPVGTSEMVDLFSGDFTYNIPLLEVEGYPVNISYNSNITNDQEASWVGLGWNINPGSITRNMRGIPDDFDGEEIQKEVSMKANRTFGVSIGRGKELAGFDAKGIKVTRNVALGINYNNYAGISMEMSMSFGLAPGKGSKMPLTGSLGFNSGANGLTISPRVGYASKIGKAENFNGSASVGVDFNSRVGLKSLTLEASISETDKNVGGSSVSGNSINYSLPISFGRTTYIPQVNTPMKSIAVTASFKWGNQAKILDRNSRIGAYFSQEKIAEVKTSKKAYGYLNLQGADERKDAVLDFNRDKDGPFGTHTSLLPMTGLTYDSYNVSGQGIGGVFRPYRNDIGYVYDHSNYSNSDSYSLGVELKLGSIVKLGADLAVTDVTSQSGQWEDHNSAKSNLKFKKVNHIPGFEPAYFKQAGELNADVDPALYNSILTENVVRLKLLKHSKFKHEVKSELEYDDASLGTAQLSSTNYRTARQNRNQNFSYINRADYPKAAVSKYLATLANNNPEGLYDIYGGACNSLGNQIGEITTVKTDGTRYVYGVASYNTKQREVAFNVSTEVSGPNYINTNYNPATGLVTYNAGVDNSKDNKKGQDNFFSATEIPPYAHSYLLTAVLSSDYVDITGDGPSSDDLGSYTKFTYKRTTDNSSLGTGKYKWRIPFEANQANYDQNIKSLPYDDQGNYLYGEKEVRFLEKIETKNYVAVFETAPRKDGFGVAGENGGIASSNPMHLLKAISLYTKPDYVANASNLTLAKPIKVVNFVYDYSLCPGIPNSVSGATSPYELSNTGGKLTLKQIYFTYSRSLKGKLSPYTFTYALDPRTPGQSWNPSYNIKCYDRWGSYKSGSQNPGYYTTSPFAGGLGVPKSRNNADYPYTGQQRSLPGNTVGSDMEITAWHLNEILLPSGAKIKIELEADDYAYVQDKKAMQMYAITGVGTSSSSHPWPGSSTGRITDLSAQKNVLFFALKTPIPKTTPNANDKFKRDYLKGIKYMYFRANMRVNNLPSASGDENYDDVSGYSEIADAGLSAVVNPNNPNNYEYGWVQLKNVCRGDQKDGSNCEDANPISKATWQFARLHCQREAMNFNNDPDPNLDPGDIFFSLVDIVGSVVKTFTGANATLNLSGIGQEMAFNRSWIRLNTPDGFKCGGGVRVKKISITDNWDLMAGVPQTASVYGQTYEYTTMDQETGKLISSGVAQNEPGIGNDENPLKLPIAARNINLNTNVLAPDDYQFQEGPIGESFYPSCNVGYSRVTIKNLPQTMVKRHATGKEVYEYYTAKDFPVIANHTSLVPQRGKSVLGKLLKFNVKDFMTTSQGFRLILNDMHGKLKSHFVYQEGKEAAISGVEYKYKTDGKLLNNSVTVINKDGSVGTKYVGLDYDFVADFREQETETVTGGLQINTYLFNIGSFPALIPPVIPQFNKETVRFRSATVNKIINKYGLLDKVISYDLGSKTTTEFLAYDAITGEVLLTRTNTSFDDNLYSLKYPAHFAYEGMSSAFKGTSVLISDAVATGFVTSGVIQTSHPYYQFVCPGDLLLWYNNGVLQSSQFWVAAVGSNLCIVNSSGTVVNLTGANQDLKIYRSGRRNMQTLPVGEVVCFHNPLDSDRDGIPDPTLPLLNQNFGVIQASASEYSDSWQTFCECGISPGSAYNPYLIGTKGNWRKRKDYAFVSTREQTMLNGNTNVRKDGTLKNFSPFWVQSSGSDWKVPLDINSATPKWTWVSEASKYSTNGASIEERDALGRYSSAYLGYNTTLVSAVAMNSKYRQSGFDSFEDYDFRACNDDHLGFKQHKTRVVGTTSHTGKRSIKVQAGSQSIQVIKVLEVCP